VKRRPYSEGSTPHHCWELRWTGPKGFLLAWEGLYSECDAVADAKRIGLFTGVKLEVVNVRTGDVALTRIGT
jgi:hypothetical protein